MRNQIKRADRILSTLRSFLLFCKSPQGQEAPVQQAVKSLQNIHLCASRSDIKAAFVTIPSASLGFLQTSESFPRLPSSFDKPKSTSIPKQLFPREGKTGTDTEPGQSRTYWTWDLITWPYICESSTRDKRSYQEVNSKHWTVKTHTRQSVKECHQRGTE